ncbi:ABC transporter permease [Rhizobium leguminosarum]|uniref:ABC transporter permease n=1 Tax=Rhizobium leguminosarum TaxID=384 RepID=UPI001C8FEBC7|nr:ABC transporter permease [Rhizobium leguminosarum]MBY2919726.1 ABC transporter permease [Rhizobium leguminosarum]MBY2975420.1 ABC transporter permease [Rhizobium leguminosarum]MBY2977662.1 ABC transporter permease [Rhizobium leguminosarum]MBY3006212.1 ABC transporter permease [Rhizobium leguminosarum]
MSLVGALPLAPRKWPSRQLIVSLLILSAILIALWIHAPNFFRYNNIVNVLLQASLLGMLAIGMAVIMIVGGIDLSLPANMAMSAVLGAFYMKATGDWGTASLIMAGAGLSIGLINGVAVAKLKMIPFVVTLAMMTIVSGTSVWVTNSLSISQLPDGFLNLFGARPLFRIPITVIIVSVLAFVITVLMRSSIAGRWAYAVGINDKSARVARVPIDRVVMASYVFGGLMAGLTAILLTARLGSASANMGNDGMVLDIVSACVVGGISIHGGAGRIFGALFGALLVTVLSNAMNLIGVSFYLSLVIKGAVIVAFVAVDSRRGGSR